MIQYLLKKLPFLLVRRADYQQVCDEHKAMAGQIVALTLKHAELQRIHRNMIVAGTSQIKELAEKNTRLTLALLPTPPIINAWAKH